MPPEGTLPSSILALPKGGGALKGIGEKFSPDLFTGTGNFTVPISLPPGRNGFQPQLNLVYSSGNGNGPFGLGWSLGIPGVSRKTSDGVPRYNDAEKKLTGLLRRDAFILSGAEDLVPVNDSDPAAVEYRPRTEGLFAQIVRHQDGQEDYWIVKSKDGLISTYGDKNRPAATAVIKKGTTDIFAWKLTETKDPFGNLVRYEYERDRGKQDGHEWDQPLLKFIRYVDYGEPQDVQFMVQVEFTYDAAERPDPFSDYRAGFEIRTTKRCNSIRVSTRTADAPMRRVRDYRFNYETDPHNGVSLLREMDIIGYDDDGIAHADNNQESKFRKQLPPLSFGYSGFAPEKRKFELVSGNDLPASSLSSPDMELVDLHGNGLPDILEMNGVVRYWRNLGEGRFDLPRPMSDAPPIGLSDPGVQMIDANGDGRTDLLVTQGPLSGYYSLQFGGLWDRRSFNKYQYAPSFDLKDPEVRLVDLTGDGVTDVLRSGTRLECFFNDPLKGWLPDNTRWVERQSLEIFPNVSFSDSRVRLADMTGDGLQDIVLVHDGNVEYWPNLGHGNWGNRISMRQSPRFPYGYDPQRLLVGDVDGDGLADVVYVDHDKVMLWLNQSGNAWSKEPIVIRGTPPATSTNHLRLADLHGTGVSGVLWSTDFTTLSRQHLMFLDFTGGVKPYVMNEMDNHMGAVTRVEYRPSTDYYLEDQKKFNTRWRTPLPFPVQVVAKVEVIDQISRGKLTTEYRYHHGYWDGAEREFRGFGMVEQLDTETFAEYHSDGLHGNVNDFKHIPRKFFSPPTLTKTWFHQGPVGEEFGDWAETDYTGEYWQGDPQLLGHTEQVNDFLKKLPDSKASPGTRRIKRDALRTLRGSILRSELYALDGNTRLIEGEEVQNRPYTVNENAYNLTEIDSPADKTDRLRIFYPHSTSQRTTQWERGDDPMTQFSFTDYRNEEGEIDKFGRPHRQTIVAMPRLLRHQRNIAGAVISPLNPNETRILATHTRTFYTDLKIEPYINDRVAQVKTYELKEPQEGPDSSSDTLAAALRAQHDAALQVRVSFDSLAETNLIGHQLNYYDGSDFEGLPIRQVERHGALKRSELLVFTDDLLNEGYKTANDDRRPVYLDGTASLPGNQQISIDDIGYRKKTAVVGSYENGYYADTKRQGLSSRGLLIGAKDALKNRTTIEYDEHDLLPVRVIDAAGMKTSATYNYRLMQPEALTDPNGNSTRVVYDEIGLPKKQFVVGLNQNGEILGGTAEDPEVSFEYNFLNFIDKGTPIFVRTKRRVRHVRDNVSSETIETYEYSDGFSRLIQSRAQAEISAFGEFGDEVGLGMIAGSAAGAATPTAHDDRVVVSGWQVFDNKGRVVEKYEPFFDRGWEFQPEDDARKGKHSSMFYDPRGQLTQTVNPDGSQQRVIFGAPLNRDQLHLTKSDLLDAGIPGSFSPTLWEIYTYDSNDLAELTHEGLAAAPDDHSFTPASVTLDGMGRARCAVARNGANATDHWFVTRSDYDIRGNLMTITDALGRAAFRHHYDLLNRVLSVDSIDAGLRTSVFDAQANLIEYRDGKGSLVVRTYDKLNRPSQLWARNKSAGTFTLRERIHYGDDNDHELARLTNTLGKAVKHYDEAGLLEMPEYDFKGNLLEKQRRTIRDELLPDWQADWPDANPDVDLDPTVYQTSTRYDALNRPTEITYPEDVDGARKKLVPQYNRAGALEAVQLENQTYVEHIAYNAKGQRVLIAYGNGVMTRHAYDPFTFRLARLRTERFTHPHNDSMVFQPGGNPFQDFTYTYDLAGNIRAIDERTPNCGYVNAPGSQGRDQLTREFTYDPIYRLLSATGRACRESASVPGLDDEPPCGFYAGGSANRTQDNAPDLTAGYTQSYTYDPAGNMRELHYQVGGTQLPGRVFGMGSLTSAQWRQAPNNRLTSLMNGTTPHSYRFDDSGNLTQQNSERHHIWDHADQMIGYRVQPEGAPAASVSARYLYGSDGIRVKKWVRNQQQQINTTVYVDGLLEHHQQITNAATTENNMLHVMDNESRIALMRVGAPVDARDASPQVQYILGDYLGSSHMVLGGNNSSADTFINREEYFPYGETSFGSFAKKRYRYNGKERDEESGLYYYGARYYQMCLSRWVSSDPALVADGLNLYSYAQQSPISFTDPDGEQAVHASDPPLPEAKTPAIEQGKTSDPTSNIPGSSYPSMSSLSPEELKVSRLLEVDLEFHDLLRMLEDPAVWEDDVPKGPLMERLNQLEEDARARVIGQASSGDSSDPPGSPGAPLDQVPPEEVKEVSAGSSDAGWKSGFMGRMNALANSRIGKAFGLLLALRAAEGNSRYLKGIDAATERDKSIDEETKRNRVRERWPGLVGPKPPAPPRKPPPSSRAVRPRLPQAVRAVRTPVRVR